jgi:3-isopropylmalate dehydrogenase
MRGAASKYTGKGGVNPIATINAASMLPDRIGEPNAVNRVMQAIMHVTGEKMQSQNASKMGDSTSQIGHLVVEAL